MTPRRATTTIFFANGAIVGSWVAQIPWVQQRFDLSTATLGAILVSMAVAVIVAVPFAGRAAHRHGSERMTLVGGVACAFALLLPMLAPRPALLVPGLFALGATSALMDVSMNSHGVHVEQQLGRPIMSSLHAGWAFGGMAGAGFAAALTALGVDPRFVVAASAGLLLALVLFAARGLGDGSAAAGDDTPGFRLPGRSVLLLAVLCLLVMVTEGAMGDWAGIYLRQDLGAAAAFGALAYSFFTAGMTAGRLVGDRVNARVGPATLVRGGALLTAVPLAIMLLTGEPLIALAGLFAVGLGVANGVPLMFSAAGRQPDTPSSVGIAAVSSLGSLGFLAGPPIIGALAQGTSLAWALSLLVIGAAVVFGLANRAVG